MQSLQPSDHCRKQRARYTSALCARSAALGCEQNSVWQSQVNSIQSDINSIQHKVTPLMSDPTHMLTPCASSSD